MAGEIGTVAPSAPSNDIFKQLANANTEDLTNETPPTPATVDFLHALADTTRPESVHHTIGTDVTQTSPGNHQHNGLDSYQILYGAGVVLPADLTAGATGAQIAASVNAINAVLRQYLGAT